MMDMIEASLIQVALRGATNSIHNNTALTGFRHAEFWRSVLPQHAATIGYVIASPYWVEVSIRRRPKGFS